MDRLDRLEEERGEVKPVKDNDTNDCPYATAEELEQMSFMEKNCFGNAYLFQ